MVYQILWDEDRHGAIAAPLHLVLYSQGGLGVAILGSLVLGLGMSTCWIPEVDRARPSAGMSLFGGLLIVFATFVAIDSIRNSLIVSYGLVWGCGALLAVRGCARLWRRMSQGMDPAERV